MALLREVKKPLVLNQPSILDSALALCVLFLIFSAPWPLQLACMCVSTCMALTILLSFLKGNITSLSNRIPPQLTLQLAMLATAEHRICGGTASMDLPGCGSRCLPIAYLLPSSLFCLDTFKVCTVSLSQCVGVKGPPSNSCSAQQSA